MFGAILGDMVGAPYEFDRGKKQRSLSFGIQDVSLQMTLL